MTDQERDRVAKEICKILNPNCACHMENCTLCDGYYQAHDQLLNWHLKEVEKAEARGMKKAAETIKRIYKTMDLDGVDHSALVVNEVYQGICDSIITAANKTLGEGKE